MKKKLLTMLLSVGIVLAGSTMVKAEEMNQDELLETDVEKENIAEIQDEEKNVPDQELSLIKNSFPDENFWNYLIEEFDQNQDKFLSRAELEAVTSIDISDRQDIKSIDGIGGFKNLTGLNCKNTRISEIMIFGLDNLQTVEVSENPELLSLSCSLTKLITLDVSGNPNLQSIDCSDNQLTVLDLSGNPDLRSLECSGNPIAVLDVSKNPNLQSLSCSLDKLTALDLSGNPNLQTLSCHGTQLTSLDLSGNPNLQRLSCTHNQLRSLNLSNNPNLHTVDIRWSPNLQTLDVTANPNLDTLYCSGAQLGSLDISKNPKLSALYIPDNQLTTLDVSKNTRIFNLRCYDNHLAKLDLSNNSSLSKRVTANDLTLGGSYVEPQSISGNIVSVNGRWTFDLAKIVGMEELGRITLATDGAELSVDGNVTFSGSDMPTELVYYYDTKNPAEDTPMTVNVALTPSAINDKTGEEITVDTDGLDLDKICKNNNLGSDANIEIVLSQDTPAKENLEKLTQAAGTNGYTITAAYEIVMTLLSNGQKVTELTDDFGSLKLTFQVDTSLAGQNAVVYQLHNDTEVIIHDGLTVSADGTVTITADKFSAFAVAVKKTSDSTTGPDSNKTDTDKKDTGHTNTNKTDTNVKEPNESKVDTKKPDANVTNAGQPNIDQANTDQTAPVTGDKANVIFWIVAAVSSITGILIRKRYHTY